MKLVAGFLILIFACSLNACSTAGAPSFELFGAFFPAWLFCGLIGLVASGATRGLFVGTDNNTIAGNFIGQKLILNEFVAYVRLSPYLQDAAKVSAAGLKVLDPRTQAILSFALCGFANFSSIAILAGAFGVVAPERRSEVARYGLRVVAAGTLSNLMSATIAGIFLSLR